MPGHVCAVFSTLYEFFRNLSAAFLVHKHTRACAMSSSLSNAAALLLIAVVFLLFLLTGVALFVTGLFSGQRIGALMGGALLVLGGVVVWRLAQRGTQMSQLASEGILSQAVVEKKKSFLIRKIKRYTLTYSYTAPDGRTLRHTPKVTYTLWSKLQVGDSVRILYLPHRPEVSALEEDVEKIRQQLHRGESRDFNAKNPS